MKTENKLPSTNLLYGTKTQAGLCIPRSLLGIYAQDSMKCPHLSMEKEGKRISGLISTILQTTILKVAIISISVGCMYISPRKSRPVAYEITNK